MSPAWVQVVRDVAIVALAIESIVVGVLLIVLVLEIRGLIVLLQQEIKPILNSANETMSTVRGTTALVGKGLVSPAIKVISYGAAARRIANILFRRSPGRKP